MADARTILIQDSTGAPATGLTLTASTSAYDKTGASLGPRNVVELGGGAYSVQVSDSDEAMGIIVVVEVGAGYLPVRKTLAVHLTDNSNQFWAVDVQQTDGTKWTGTAPTVGAYRWDDGTDRIANAPATLTIAGAWLYAWVPSAADLTSGASIRIDGPAGSLQPYWEADTAPVQNVAPVVPLYVAGNQTPESLATRALVEWLRAMLPAKCAALNASSRASLVAAVAGPYTFAASGALAVSAIGSNDTGSTVSITAGTYTASQLAAVINTAAPANITAAVDWFGRLVLTSTVAPAEDAPSVVALLSDEDSGINSVLGWEAGGELAEVAALVAPGYRNVVDGDWILAPDTGAGFVVRVLDRQATPVPGTRYAEFDVSLEVEVLRPFGANATPHRDRNSIEACMRAVREVISNTSAGRQLGRAEWGDVQIANVVRSAISGDVLMANGVSFEAGAMSLQVRVYQPPSGN